MKVCTIGCGWVAQSNHGPAYRHYAASHPDIEFTACCDIDLARAEHFRDRFGFQRAYTDFELMLDREQPDAVCLLSPPSVTTQIACQVFARGIPLLLEKPPGLTAEEVGRLWNAAKQGGVPHLVAFNRRFTPLVTALKDEITTRFQPQDLQHLSYEFTRIGRTDPDFSTTAIHGIDTATFIAGSAYSRIDFRYQPLPQMGKAVANVYLDCQFQSGAAAHLAFCPVSGALTERATLVMHDHSYYLQLPLNGGADFPGRLVHYQKGVEKMSINGIEAAGSSKDSDFLAADWYLNGFYHENALFFDALREGRQPPAGLETTIQSVEIMQALRERKSYWAAEVIDKERDAKR